MPLAKCKETTEILRGTLAKMTNLRKRDEILRGIPCKM
jgi:hypothetical protein